MIERSILATDLAIHFREAKNIRSLADMASSNNLDLGDESARRTLQTAMMTAADLGAVSKPWNTHFHVTQLVAEEFWAQGDLEREAFHEEPAPMLDRQASLAVTQLDFIDNVCKDVYSDMKNFHPTLGSMLDGVLSNRERWSQKNEEKPTKLPMQARNL